MSGIQSKITKHAKKKAGKMTYNEENSKPIKTDPELAQTLLDEDIKRVNIHTS